MVSLPLMISIDWLCLIISYTICAARIVIVRKRVHKRKSWLKYDTEAILVFALVVGTTNMILNTWKNVKNLHHHGPQSDSEKIFAKKLIYSQSYFYYMDVWAIKAAFLSTYFHFRHKITKPNRIALYILTCLVVVTFIGITLTMLLKCLPVERAWSLGSDYCSPQQVIWVHSKTAALNIATDLGLVALFLSVLREMHLGSRERCGVAFFLSISSIPIIAAILRLTIITISLQRKEKRTQKDIQQFNEVLYLASTVEVTFAFIAACLPAMRALLRAKKEAEQYSRSSNEFRGATKTSLPKSPRLAFLPPSTSCSNRSANHDYAWGNLENVELRVSHDAQHDTLASSWPPHGT